jgi:putative SOS response-associated peptidase YedK
MRTFTIITMVANVMMADLPDRMPVFIESVDWPTWLGEIEGESATCQDRPVKMP